MMELHEMYATLTAKKPILAVPNLRFEVCGRCSIEHADWYRGPGDGDFVADDCAAALIRVRWEDALPSRHLLCQTEHGFSVVQMIGWGIGDVTGKHRSAIEALYHFHMEQA